MSEIGDADIRMKWDRSTSQHLLVEAVHIPTGVGIWPQRDKADAGFASVNKDAIRAELQRRLSAALVERLPILAGWCELAEPSAALDATIKAAVIGGGGMPKRYTTSLDAAVTLVPEGWLLHSMRQGDPASLKSFPNCAEAGPHRGTGKTLALAICAAALKARAAKEPK